MTVRELLDAESAELDLRLLAGRRGLDTVITSARVQKPGLALGASSLDRYQGEVQVLGPDETEFLDSRKPDRRREIAEALVDQRLACLIVASAGDPPRELRDGCSEKGIALLVTDRPAAEVIDRLAHDLEGRLAPRLSLHGTLLDLYGLGILLLGESGVGKSECALDLITRGHRLVSDDVVMVLRVGDQLVGTGPELSRYHMEVRGIGLLNVKDLFGVAAVRPRKDVELVIRLESWKTGKEYERLGLDEKTHEILGVELPLLEIPVAPGRDLAMLTEVAARNQLLKKKGFHPARELTAQLERRLSPETARTAGDGPDGKRG